MAAENVQHDGQCKEKLQVAAAASVTDAAVAEAVVTSVIAAVAFVTPAAAALSAVIAAVTLTLAVYSLPGTSAALAMQSFCEA